MVLPQFVFRNEFWHANTKEELEKLFPDGYNEKDVRDMSLDYAKNMTRGNVEYHGKIKEMEGIWGVIRKEYWSHDDNEEYNKYLCSVEEEKFFENLIGSTNYNDMETKLFEKYPNADLRELSLNYFNSSIKYGDFFIEKSLKNFFEEKYWTQEDINSFSELAKEAKEYAKTKILKHIQEIKNNPDWLTVTDEQSLVDPKYPDYSLLYLLCDYMDGYYDYNNDVDMDRCDIWCPIKDNLGIIAEIETDIDDILEKCFRFSCMA